jgi:hypothetical protein
MTYEELRKLVSGYNPQSASYEDIISGIQSQYTPQTQFAPTGSLLDSMGALTPDQPRIAYGALLEAQPRKAITPFDITKYRTDSTDTSGTGSFDIGGGGDGGTGASTSGNAGFTIGIDGLATPNTVSPVAAVALGMVTGLPVGLVTSQMNAANTAAANAHNAAMAAEAIDSIATTGPTATAGATGTGAAAAAAGTAAAAAATAAGASPAAAAAAGQAAANASVAGASAAAAAAAGAQAAADATNAAAATAADADAGSDGSAGAATSGSPGWAKGGLVTMDRLIGTNPMGQDEGYGALQSGEYVIKKNAVDKYGEEFLGLLNSGKLTKKQINSLL